MDVDKERNCHSCEEFAYLAQNCRRQGIVNQGRRVEYKDNGNTRNNLNRKGYLIVLD